MEETEGTRCLTESEGERTVLAKRPRAGVQETRHQRPQNTPLNSMLTPLNSVLIRLRPLYLALEVGAALGVPCEPAFQRLAHLVQTVQLLVHERELAADNGVGARQPL